MAEALLKIAGELCLPFLAANAYALAPFKYQVKCLQQLRDKFAGLDAEAKSAQHPVLERTGCWRHLIGS